MSDIFFEEMRIPLPDYRLGINSLSHGAMTGRMLEEIEKIILKENPNFVVVYGDTNSTLAGALAAIKLHIKVCHVEAGLRSFNNKMPEEVNRILTDRISALLCCPTDTAVGNLEKEGFALFPCTVVKTGDVMLDAALYYSAISSGKSTIIRNLELLNKPFVLCTIHRAENTDDATRLSEIVAALNEINRKMTVVLPIHPRTRKLLTKLPVKLKFNPIEPVGYFDMLELLKATEVVLTDSGGLQKEAYFFGKFCITLRDETEWVELQQGGYNELAGADRERILNVFRANHGILPESHSNLYGEGVAGETIINKIVGLI
jgi:UDP-GlcNAc3NAcA epimerase